MEILWPDNGELDWSWKEDGFNKPYGEGGGDGFYVWSGHWSVKIVWWLISEIEVIVGGQGYRSAPDQWICYVWGTGPLVSMPLLYQLCDRCEILRINQ